MGYVRITKPDGTEIFIGEEFEDVMIIETCDVCNEPRPIDDLTNVGERRGEQRIGAIWECSKCHAISGTKKDG